MYLFSTLRVTVCGRSRAQEVKWSHPDSNGASRGAGSVSSDPHPHHSPSDLSADGILAQVERMVACASLPHNFCRWQAPAVGVCFAGRPPESSLKSRLEEIGEGSLPVFS